jgi:outer membrane immunogenic protein
MNRHSTMTLATPTFRVGSLGTKPGPSVAERRGRPLRRFIVASLAAAGLLGGLGAAASAADLPPAPVYTKVPIAPAYNWTGCYVGGHAGGGLIESTLVNTINNQGAGGLAGGQLGCNYQAGQLVFGLEGEGAWSSITDRFHDVRDGFILSTARNRWDADLSLRVGFAVDRALVYGKTGAALGNFDFKFDSTNFFSRGQSTLDGLLLGAGLEYGFTPSWTAKLEYNFIAFAGKDVSFSSSDGPSMVTEAAKKQIVKLGLNYRFGN